MNKCPGVVVDVTGGGSSVGARRLCNVTSAGSPVEIGNMSRNWNSPAEANITDPNLKKFTCNFGTKGRNVTQIDVAIDALTITIIRGGVARQNCTDQMPGNGLTIDQLRWMFSNYSTAQLISSGWNKNASIPNDDNNETSHLWSELTTFPFCPKKEIKLASPGPLSGTFAFFKENVLPNATEGLANNRPFTTLQSDIEADLIQYVQTSSIEMYGDAIAFFASSQFFDQGQVLLGVPIQAKGATAYVQPTQQNIFDSTYVPFSRRIYMNVLDSSLTSTGPFISYGFNQEGQVLLQKNGFVKLPSSELPSILARIGRDPPLPPAPVPTARLLRSYPISLPVAPVKAPTKKPCGVRAIGTFTFCGIFSEMFCFC
jgi:ABC-type phosphate transport system substrate-binding protein